MTQHVNDATALAAQDIDMLEGLGIGLEQRGEKSAAHLVTRVVAHLRAIPVRALTPPPDVIKIAEAIASTRGQGPWQTWLPAAKAVHALLSPQGTDQPTNRALPSEAAIAQAICKADGTKQCAAICLTHSCLIPAGQCPEARHVWGRKASAVLALLKDTDQPTNRALPPALDRETIQTLLDLLNPLHGSLDEQTYDEKVDQNFDAPADAVYSVEVTAQMERDLTQAVKILESRRRDTDQPTLAEPRRQP